MHCWSVLARVFIYGYSVHGDLATAAARGASTPVAPQASPPPPWRRRRQGRPPVRMFGCPPKGPEHLTAAVTGLPHNAAMQWGRKAIPATPHSKDPLLLIITIPLVLYSISGTWAVPMR